MSFFRARAAATQSIPASTETELIFGTELSDPDGVFASNRFTVPAGWDGRIGGMTLGLELVSNANPFEMSIQRQTGGVGGFVSIATVSNTSREYLSLSVCPIVFSAGDVYRAVCFTSAGTRSNLPTNFFSGWVFPDVTKLGLVRAEMTTTTGSLSANQWVGIVPNTEIIDSHNVFASGVLTVPSDFNGGFLHITGGVRTLADQVYLGIEISTNGGMSWTVISPQRCASGTFECNIDAGAIAAVTGDQFRLTCYMVASTFQVAADPKSFFAAALFKY